MTAEPRRRASRALPVPGYRVPSGGSPAQRERRDRMLGAAVMLATQGGYEAVTMRAVAENADVALGTLYRYFPSKNHLLVTGLIGEFDRAQSELERIPVPGEDPAARMLFVLGRVTRMFHRYPRYTEAITRAFTVADDSAAEEVATVGRQMEVMFAGAMHPRGAVTPENAAVARVIGDVWLANLVSWVSRRMTAEEVDERLELAVRLLLDPAAAPGRGPRRRSA